VTLRALPGYHSVPMASSEARRGILVLAFLVGCGEATGPAIEGRWAKPGMALVATSSSAELRLYCIQPIRLPRLVPDWTGAIRFAAAVREQGNTFDLRFVGRFRGDTLSATITWTVPGRTPYVTTHVLTPDGVYTTGPLVCPAGGAA